MAGALPVATIVIVGLTVSVVVGRETVAATLRYVKIKTTTSGDGLLSSGTIIGLLERNTVFAAVLVHHPEGVDLIVIVKSVARFPEFSASAKNDQASGAAIAEIFIIGTLTSLLIALACGYAVLHLLQ